VFAALFQVLQLPAPWVGGSRPSDLLIVGGGSNCGRFAVQLAKLAGITNIVVVGGSASELKGYGATHVFDRHLSEDQLVNEIRTATNGKLLFALDAVNFPDGLGLAFRSLSTSDVGKVARLVPLGTFEERRGHELLDVLGLFHYREDLCIAMWRELTTWVERGSLVASPSKIWKGLSAEVGNAALDEYRDGKNKLKPQIEV
jgi:NADPH:quinone reductase